MMGIRSETDDRLWITGRRLLVAIVMGTSTAGWAVVFRRGQSVKETKRTVQAYLNHPIFFRSDECRARTEVKEVMTHAENVRPLGHTWCVGCQTEEMSVGVCLDADTFQVD